MSRTATYADESGVARNPLSPQPEEILTQLQAILASPSFTGSKRGHQFLEYVCAKSLAGEEGALKERVLAIEVFGRHPDVAGHSDDTIVRVGAREVRKRLAQYYVSPEGSAAPVVIELPAGSYVPEFRYAATPAIPLLTDLNVLPVRPVLAPSAEPAVEPVEKGRKRIPALAILAASILVVALIAVVRWAGADPAEQMFVRFWEPVLRSSTPLLIGVGNPIVYHPSKRASVLSASRQAPSAIPKQQQLNLRPEETNGSDFIPIVNQFVGFGDLVAANDVSQMLARRSHPVRILLASNISFADLRQSQAYLIGSLTNHWSMELGQNWRFQFAWGTDHRPVFRDTFPGSQREWATPVQEDGTTMEDYSLICRVRSSATGQFVIVAAGIKQFGTEAAGRVLAAPAELSRILEKLPAGWENRNLQIVLRTRVIGNTPAEPVVVASHLW